MEACSGLLSRSTQLRLDAFITHEQARQVIRLLNSFRKSNVKKAFDILFLHFVWKPNGLPKQDKPILFIEVISNPRP